MGRSHAFLSASPAGHLARLIWLRLPLPEIREQGVRNPTVLLNESLGSEQYHSMSSSIACRYATAAGKEGGKILSRAIPDVPFE
jgi:hypothetical protein